MVFHTDSFIGHLGPWSLILQWCGEPLVLSITNSLDILQTASSQDGWLPVKRVCVCVRACVGVVHTHMHTCMRVHVCISVENVFIVMLNQI